MSAADLDELNIEIIRNTLYKSYLEDFSAYCQTLGGPTSEIMADVLEFEADRRTINITVNSLGTQLTKEQRANLFPALGKLYPAGNSALARADDLEQVKSIVEQVGEYRDFFSDAGRASGAASGFGEGDEEPHAAAESLEDHFFRVRFSLATYLTEVVITYNLPQTEVHLNKLAFLQQFQFGVFYAYFKLKEQVSFCPLYSGVEPFSANPDAKEIRNITWISECVAQNARDRIGD